MAGGKPKPDSDEDKDAISECIGEFGRWQLLHTFLLSLFNIPCTWHIFAPTFLNMDRDVWCSQTAGFKNISDELWRKCTQPNENYCHIYNPQGKAEADFLNCDFSGAGKVTCNSWSYAGSGSTLKSEFDLLCDRQYLNNLMEMTFLAGVAFGGLICGILSDKLGRKKMLMISVLIQSILGTVIAFAPWFELYFILRASLGFISVSVVFSGFVLSIELVGGKYRTIAGISYLFPVSISYAIISYLAYEIRDWRRLQLAVSVPGFAFIILWFVLPESPRWLLAMDKKDELKSVLESAAKMNKKPLPANLEKHIQTGDKSDCEPETKIGVLDLFRTRSMRKRTLILFLIWFGVYLVYYGLMLNLGKIGGNIYVNSAIMGFVEIPAIAMSILILIRGERRWPLALTMITSGVCIFTIPIDLYAPNLQWLSTTLTMISKLCISSSNAIMPVYTAELYPTTIRNLGMGAANVPAGIALMLVPNLWNLADFHMSVPMAVISFFGIIGGASVLLLPETGKKPLPDTLEKDPPRISLSQNELKRMSNTSESKRINNNS